MLEKKPLTKDFIERLKLANNGEEVDLKAFLSEIYSIDEEEADKELKKVQGEALSIIQKHIDGKKSEEVSNADLIYDFLRLLKKKPTVRDFLLTYYLTVAVAKLAVDQYRKFLAEDDELFYELLEETGWKDRLSEKVELRIGYDDESDETVVKVRIPNSLIDRTIVKIFEEANPFKAFIGMMTLPAVTKMLDRKLKDNQDKVKEQMDAMKKLKENGENTEDNQNGGGEE